MGPRIRAKALLGAWLLACGAGALAAVPTLTVGFFDLPPHAVTVNGQIRGAAIDYFQLIAKEMRVTPRFIKLPLARLLQDERVDVVLFLGKNRERERMLVFAQQPLLHMVGGIAVRNDSPLARVDISDDLLGLTIGVWDAGYRGRLMRDARLKLYPMPSDSLSERGPQMVVLKRLDAFYNPELRSLQDEVLRLGLESQIRVLTLPSGDDALYTAFSKAAAPKYRARFDRAYAAVQKRVRYDVFLMRYLAGAAQP